MSLGRATGRLSLCLIAILSAHWFYQHHTIGSRISKTLWGLNLLHYSKFIAELPSEDRGEIETELRKAASRIRVETPQLEPRSGRFEGPITVNADCTQLGAVLRYTLDGSVPTRSDPELQEGLSFQRSGVLRVKAFQRGRLASETATATYIIGYEGDLAITSLVLDPVYLFDKHAGIYSNPFQKGSAWERPAEIAVLSPSSDKVLQTEVRLRIHGNWSRRNPTKSFRVYIKPEAGDIRSWFGSQAHLLSPNQREWVLRHVNINTLHRDRLGTKIARQLGLPASPVVPTVLFLNGEIWGVYDLMERVNPEFIAGKQSVESLTLLRGSLADPEVVIGDSEAWAGVYDFIESSNLSVSEIYSELSRQFDLDNLVDFWILHIFIADFDSPDSNMDIYRVAEDGPWRFLVWDLDNGFSANQIDSISHDTIAWHTRDTLRPDLKPNGTDKMTWVRSAALFRQLMKSADFRNRFRARFEELLDTVLSSEALASTFDDLLTVYESAQGVELLRQPNERPEIAAALISEQVEMIYDFILHRPAVIRELLRKHASN